MQTTVLRLHQDAPPSDVSDFQQVATGVEIWEDAPLCGSAAERIWMIGSHRTIVLSLAVGGYYSGNGWVPEDVSEATLALAERLAGQVGCKLERRVRMMTVGERSFPW